MGYMRQIKGMLLLGESVASICSHLGISECTYHRWLEKEQSQRMNHVRMENDRLKQTMNAMQANFVEAGNGHPIHFPHA